MDVLLGNTKKATRRSEKMGVSMGINLSTDTSRLEVCFGGFAPTAMNAGVGLDEIVDKAEALMREHREMKLKLEAMDAARASEQRVWEDEFGSSWTYVVLDGIEVRIVKCSTDEERIEIPEAIENLPVVALAADACAFLPSVTEVSCPDGLLSIGFCAFRNCKNLKKAKLPASVSHYDSGWFRACEKLEVLELPGHAERIDSSIFDVSGIRVLKIGSGTFEVMPGAFAKSKLTSVEVSEDNPFMMTDGKALYSKDGSVMIALAVPCESYEVLDGCKVIARKGFSGFDCLKSVKLPESLELLGGFAYAKTSVSEFVSPASLRVVEEKAFFMCRKLEEVSFGEGLVALGENAFTGTGIRKLLLPSTVKELGNPLAEGTALIFAGPDATFGIAKGSTGSALELDERGGLYRNGNDGLEFVLLLDPEAKRYEIREGTVVVCPKAFAGHAKLAEVVLPEGVREISEAAFKGARALTCVNVPESVCEIGEEAFLDTNIRSVYLPSGLRRLGKNALITQGAHYSASVRSAKVKPSLRNVTVGEGNARFFVEDGLLLERAGTGGSLRVLLCMGGVEVVRIPAEVNEVAPYALNNVPGIRELYLSDRIVMVGIRGLAVDGFVELIHVDLVKMQHGRGFFELRFPDTDRGVQQMMLALSVPDHVNVEVLFSHYDNAITNGSSFDAATEKGLDVYDQATRLLKRLQDPVYLKLVNQRLCESFLRNNAELVCLALAKHDDREAIDAMLDFGFLNADNIYGIIERVSALQDASMTNYLLEARRMRFEQSVFDDFDL